jgi:hypothetical protein
MLDILRNLRKSDQEKQQEALNAYLDGTLTPDRRQQIEKILEQDARQRAELDQMRLLRQEMRQFPSRRIPRSFTLDPALYARPRREPLVQAYPVLRTATALAAFFFVFALAANLFVGAAPGMSSNAGPVALQPVAEMETVAELAVEEITEAETLEEEEEPIVTEAEVVMEEAAAEESAAAALLPEEKVAIPEMEEALDTADAQAAERPMESLDAAPFQRAEASPELIITVPAERRAEQAEPTMAAEGAINDELAEGIPAAPASAATGVAALTESSPRLTAVARDEAEMSMPEVQSRPDTAPSLNSSLGMIVLLLGAVFLILVSLTLMARRRL